MSNVHNWSVDDVARWFSTLELSKDYSSKIKELLINGETLINSNNQSLLSLTNTTDHITLSKAINTLLPHSISLPHSPLSCPTTQSITVSSPPTSSFLSLPDNGTNTRNYFNVNVKSKSLDELLNETVPCDRTASYNYSSHLFDILRTENISLKNELHFYYKRVSRLQKLELELQQLQDSYRLLEGSSNRKAKLEKAMRQRLEEELLRMKQTHAHHRAELHSMKRSSSLIEEAVDISRLQDHPADTDTVIEKLLQQNDESISLRQKLEDKLQFTKSTLEMTNCCHGNIKRRSEPVPHRYTNGRQHEYDVTGNLEALEASVIAMQTSSDNRQQLIKQLEKCSQLKQLINETRQYQLEHTNIDEELKTVRIERDKYLLQLQETNNTIKEQKKRIHTLEDCLKDKQLLIDKLQTITSHYRNGGCNSPAYTNHCTTTLTPPTLPSYSEHLNGIRYTTVGHSPIPPVYAETGSHSFPNTPEAIRKKSDYSVPPTRTYSDIPHSASTPFIPHSTGIIPYTSNTPCISYTSNTPCIPYSTGIYKSLTPPPTQYNRPRPPMIASHSVSHNVLQYDNDQSRQGHYDSDQSRRADHYDIIDILDDSIDSISSPSSQSPPTQYFISNSTIHEHSNSFPNYSH